MMRSFHVRAAKPTDLPDIIDLIKAKAVFDGATQSPKLSESAMHDALFAANPRTSALVAEWNGTLVGLATYYDIYSSFLGKPGLWLDDLFVAEQARGFGVGKALLQHLCAEAKAKECARIDWLVAVDNTNGQSFYKALGADIFETTRHARLNAAAIERLSVSNALHNCSS